MRIDLSKFKDEISNITEYENITEEKATQANHASLIKIKNTIDAFYFFSSINLLNAYVKDPKRNKNIVGSYRFKKYLLNGIEQIIVDKIKDVKIYISKEEDVIYIKIFNFQFSFHSVGSSDIIMNYSKTNRNIFQKWEGIRLQPISQIIFNKAIELKNSKNY